MCIYSDLVSGLIALMNSDYSQPVNLGNPEEHTITEFAKIVQKEIGEWVWCWGGLVSECVMVWGWERLVSECDGVRLVIVVVWGWGRLVSKCEFVVERLGCRIMLVYKPKQDWVGLWKWCHPTRMIQGEESQTSLGQQRNWAGGLWWVCVLCQWYR